MDFFKEVKKPGAPAPAQAEIEITQEEIAGLAAMRSTQLTAPELPPISIDAVNYANTNYTRMDGNGDGFVTATELDGFAKANSKTLSAEEKKLVEELKSNMDNLQAANRDESSWYDNDGFTRKDLMKVTTDATASANPSGVDTSGTDLRPALDYAKQHFKDIDSNGNGYLTVAEIDKYQEDNELSAEETKLLRTLKENGLAVRNSHSETYIDPFGATSLLGMSEEDITTAHDKVNSLAFGYENFSALDADGNGFITNEELTGFEKARRDLTQDELKALQALRDANETLAHKNSDEIIEGGDGFTGYDIQTAMADMGSVNAKGLKKFGEKPASTEVASATPPEAGAEETERPEAPAAPEAQERTYTVKPNDSLWKICREDLRARNGKEPSYKDILHEIDQVAALNSIERDAIINPEQTLKLRPASAQETPASPVEPTRVRPVEPTRVRPVEPTRIAPVEPTGIAPGEPAPPRRERPSDKEDRPTERQRRDERPRRPQERNLSSTDVLRKHFDNIDLNGNKRVSEREIRQYLYDFGPEISDKDRIALNRIARQAGKIQELANDEKGDENTGISARDLQKVDEMQEAARIMQKSGMWMDFNTNGDKYLKKNEIEQALRRANISEEERRALNYLYDNYGKFQEGNNDERGDENSGITWNDLRWYASFV